MKTRKEMKQRAKRSLKKHYGLLLVVCLLAAYIGAEFSGTLQSVKAVRQDAQPTGGRVSGSYDPSGVEVLMDALNGNLEESRETAREITEEAVQDTKSGRGSRVLGRSRGVLAGLVNGIDSGSIFVNLVSAARNIGMAQNLIMVTFILFALGIWFCVWFFFINMYKAVSRRIFLESRTYEKVSIQRFLAFMRVKRWPKVSFTMFMTFLFQSLWNLTFVGGIIKRYSYRMVPYITAENPDVGWKEAITLSRRMMDGHKWECFVLDASFFLWYVLGVLTFGLSDLFFTNMYKVAAFSEYYGELRAIAKEKKLEGCELMNDIYLYEKADTEVLERAYADIIEQEKHPLAEVELKGFRGFLANVFGITLLNREDESRYEAREEQKLRIRIMQAAVEGKSYPSRLSTIPEKQKNSRVEQIHYLRHYSLPSLILLFFIFSLIGWMWEVSLHLITDGEFVNRGVLHGPWLPIYGTGGILILTVLNKFRKNPAVQFVATVILCGCVEYFTAYYLEMTHGGQKWWDYSGYFLNLHGRICAEGLLVFGIGGMAIAYLAAPLLDNHLRKIKYKTAVPLCAALLLVFTADQIYSRKHPNAGKGITDYKGACIERQIPQQMQQG